MRMGLDKRESKRSITPLCPAFARVESIHVRDKESLPISRVFNGLGPRHDARIWATQASGSQTEPVEIRHPDSGVPMLWVVPAGYSGPKKAPAGATDLLVSTKEGWGDGYHPTTVCTCFF